MHPPGDLSRRNFLQAAGALGAGFAGLRHRRPGARSGTARATDGLGPLIADPAGILDLPQGFAYTAISRVGEQMDDGFLVPARHDGMAAFAGGDGKTVLVRNHENTLGLGGAFGAENERLARLPEDKCYDRSAGGKACLGGTTTLVFDTGAQRLERHWLSLAGTLVNCAGGATPWGSWISCEEIVLSPNAVLQREHGYCFEVPALAEGLVDPVPLKGLGRFRHEAIAVDPASGCVYLTEDMFDGLLYRFVPDTPGELAAGGKLQALRVRAAYSVNTCNWNELTRLPVGRELEVDWVTLDDVESPGDDLRRQGFLKGAARFSRGEGIHYGAGAVYFCCTSGGRAKGGQVWRYVPSPVEGTTKERRERGHLSLWLEPDDLDVLDGCDNLCLAPWGHLVLCEDGNAVDHLLGVTPAGMVYVLARNAGGASEFAGATFSPDGSTLFVNVQVAGITLAISGPWERARAL